MAIIENALSIVLLTLFVALDTQSVLVSIHVAVKT